LQNIHYTYDPAGNITAIRDDAQQTIYFDGQVVRPDAEYIYDAIYRLIEATGREHIGQALIPHTTWNDQGRVNLAHPHDGQKMRRYFEFYEYDEVGNIRKFDHQARDGNWIRAYYYNEVSLIEPGKKSNRLSQTIVHPNGQRSISEYTYDPHGNMTSMPHLQQMEWDFEDQLHYVEKGSEEICYVYDAAGQRVRKVVEKNNNGALIEERIYLGGFEVFRRSNGNGLKLERETLHVMDDQQRIALVETKTWEDGLEVIEPEPLIRYQLNNHLGSSSLELDEDGVEISYEEYYPYGSTSYQAADKNIKAAAKRYRYTGKERDDETGLYYYGARYYAAWLGRWVSCDPMGLVDGPNLYVYTYNSPTQLVDIKGTQAVNPEFNTIEIRPVGEEAMQQPLPEVESNQPSPPMEREKKFLKLLQEFAKETSNRQLLKRLGLVPEAIEAIEKGKDITEKLAELRSTRVGRRPSRRGSGASLIIDALLEIANTAGNIAAAHISIQKEEALIDLIEGAKELGIEPYLIMSRVKTTGVTEINKFFAFISPENKQARMEYRRRLGKFFQTLIDVEEERASGSRWSEQKTKEYQSIQAAIEKEISFLKRGKYVKAGGRVNIYKYLGIHSGVLKRRLEDRQREKKAAFISFPLSPWECIQRFIKRESNSRRIFVWQVARCKRNDLIIKNRVKSGELTGLYWLPNDKRSEK
jgi:RHS repeat-associated protein